MPRPSLALRIQGSLVAFLAALCVAGSTRSAAAAADRPSNPWALIESVRGALAAEGRQSADFTQTYTPAGFASGENESGRLALALPDCLRWDYFAPDAKSFLLCGADAYTWTAGDAEGRHQRVEPRDEPGLDLLLLPMEHLRQRYDASAQSRGQGSIVTLTPRTEPTGKKKASPLQATLELDAGGKRLLSLGYTDRDGNRTRFAISNYHAITDPSLFLPPPELRWREQ